VNPDGLALQGRGFTRDISSNGAYVYAEVQPPANTEVQIEILLPPSLEGYSSLRMRAKTKIIRVEPDAIDEHSGGFVAHSDFYVLKEDLTHCDE
jgi:hypothetical protein